MIPGVSHFPAEMDVQYGRLALGVAWPAVRPGWCVVVGEHRAEFVGDGPRLDVLDEASDPRLWHVVERAAALWWYYRPERLWGDARHVAALQFVTERQRAADYEGFRLEASPLVVMDRPFAYALPILERLFDSERLVLPAASGLRGERLVVPRHEDPGALLPADYPAIAALAFAVLGLEQTRPDPRADRAAAAGLGRIYE